MNFSNVLGLLSSATVVAVFILWMPYAQGYLGGRVTLGRSLRSMWAYEQWQHCWLVIPALLVVLFAQRKELARLPLRGTAWGLVPLIAAFILYWAGYRVENYYIGFFSIHLMIGALILWIGGWKWLWSLIFAYAFLAFVWPLYFLEGSITSPLRMIMSRASADVLRLIGIPVLLQGTGLISAPEPMLGLQSGQRFRVDVADPCSGIRSLFALMMISALYGHFTLKIWWQKGILFLSSIPLAILGNLFRILMLTFGIMTLGPEIAIGADPLTDPSWFHMLAGYLVFAVALGGMIAIGSLLSSLIEKGPKPVRSPIDASEGRTQEEGVQPPGAEGLLSDSGRDPY